MKILTDAPFSRRLQGITGIRFAGGEKCYIKTQVKARLPDVAALNKESMTFELVGGPGSHARPDRARHHHQHRNGNELIRFKYEISSIISGA